MKITPQCDQCGREEEAVMIQRPMAHETAPRLAWIRPPDGWFTVSLLVAPEDVRSDEGKTVTGPAMVAFFLCPGCAVPAVLALS